MKRWLLGMLCLCACNADAGSGKVAFTTWGEEYIEEEIPASEFADGWRVHYTKFLVALSDITVAGAAGEGAKDTAQRVFDLTKPGKKAVFEAELEAKEWEAVSYRIGPVVSGAIADPSATQADLDAMIAGKYSVYVEGRGEKDGVTKRFAWGFGADTTYKNCRGEVGGVERPGAVVTAGGTDTIELTIHGDHLFYDDLASADAKLRFVNIASADANDDGEVTLDELNAVNLEDLVDGTYQVGGFSDVFTYRDFVTRLSRTVGHFRGEGECEL